MLKKFKLICVCGEEHDGLVNMLQLNPDDEITCYDCGLVWKITVEKSEE